MPENEVHADSPMRIAIVYDRVYPAGIGGGERYARRLAEILARDNDVTYLTPRMWPKGKPPPVPFTLVPVSATERFYTRGGRRRTWPALRFAIGVFWHLLLHGRSYDVVHLAAYPYFPPLAARFALSFRRHRAAVIVDWFEIWTLPYWLDYFGKVRGRLGYAVQRLSLRAADHGFTFSRLHQARLVAEGHRAPVTRLHGLHALPSGKLGPRLEIRKSNPPFVVFAGRFIPEKQTPLIPEVIRRARMQIPDLHGALYGDGPDRERVASAIRELGLQDAIALPGFVSDDELESAIESAACLLLPSVREGYGLVVVEAAALGTPSVVVDAPDNAAVELITEGVNGFIAASTDPSELAASVVETVRKGDELSRSTLDWYRERAGELSASSSAVTIQSVYQRLLAAA